MNPVIIGDCQLYLGDCALILPTLPKVDCVITDPPYGIGAGAKSFKNGTRKHAAEYVYGDWDSSAPDVDLLAMSVGAGDTAIVWGGNYFDLPPSRCWLIWDKGIPSTMTYAMAELAWTNMDAVVSVHKTTWIGANAKDSDGRLHPTQKPIAVMRWCIEQAGNPQTILDPFMGSGTTGIAAVQMGRKFIGIEREEKYFSIACKRIEQAYAQDDWITPKATVKPVQESLAIGE